MVAVMTNLYLSERLPGDQTGSVAEPKDIGVLLGVWAHPDDEVYLSAGLMAAVRRAGQRVVVATATKGELGTDDPGTFPPERVSFIRAREAAAALAELGVMEHRWLGHRDGTLPDRRARGVQQVKALIDEVRPDTIVTFGPEGMTGHADHRAVSEWVTTAWNESGRPSRLWYATLTPEFHHAWGSLNDEVGLWFDGSKPPSDASDELAFELRCDEELLNRKFAALSAHASQTSVLIDLVGTARYRQWWSAEYFVDA
jgi:LmbE family N-acetylglucosaminyl deacetylase